MAATKLERQPFRKAGFVSNLADARWFLLALAAFLLVLALTGALTPLVAIVILAVVTALVAVLPVARSREPAVTLSRADANDVELALQRTVEALPDPSLILDRRGMVRFLNRRAISELPLRAGDLLTFRLRVPDLLAAFDRVAKGGPPERIEYVERVPTERWYAAWFARIESPGTTGALVLLIIDDLTERRRTERVRVDFVANASHELRTPLASLTGFIETLQGPAKSDPAARDRFLSIMHDQAARMSRLVNDLLSLSRVEMKAHVRPTDRIDLSAIVSHIVDALEPLARELGVTIEKKLPATPVEIVGDRDELIQVFENLIENACKYGQSGKRVVVALLPGTGESGPAVSVRDFGPGIAEEHVPRLTERFYRVDVEVSRRHRGTGLGLAIVKHILARHQARMAVESAVGSGTVFSVTFQTPAS